MRRSKLKQLVEAALQDDGPLGADARITLREMDTHAVKWVVISICVSVTSALQQLH